MSDGMRFDIQEVLTSAPQRGKVILLLGTAADGPVGTPVSVSDSAKYQKIFGDPSIGDLGRAFNEIHATNENLDIHLMRISGEHAIRAIWKPVKTDVFNILKFRSRYAGAKYNYLSIKFDTVKDSQDVLRNAMIVAMEDETLSPTDSWVYFLDDFEVVNDLVSNINTDARLGMVPVTCSTELPYTSTDDLWASQSGTKTYLMGGEDGLDLKKNDRFRKLADAYSLLEGYYIDVVVPLNAFLDDTHPVAFYGTAQYGDNVYAANRDYLSLMDGEKQNSLVTFHEQLIDFCQRQVSLGIFTHGVLGLNTVEDVSFVTDHPHSYIERLLNATAFKDRRGFADFINGQWNDKGHFASVVAGEFIFNKGTPSEYIGNAYVVYAAMLASLYGPVSTTNEPVPTPNVELRYQFSTEELQDLAFMGVTSFRWSPRRGTVVSNGVTAALPTSDMHYVSNMRMVQLTMSMVDAVTEGIVGRDLQPIVANKELDKMINQTLSYLTSSTVGILKGFTFQIKWDSTQQTGTIELELMPRFAFEFTGVSVGFKTTKG